MMFPALTVRDLISLLMAIDGDQQVFIYEGSVTGIVYNADYVMLDTDHYGTP